jgi:plasmid stability protein
MVNLQIRDVPDDIHAELRRRARASGRSLREYVLELLRADQALPTREEWLARVHGLDRIEVGISPAEIIRERRGSEPADRDPHGEPGL